LDPITSALAFSYKFNKLNNGTTDDIIRMALDDPSHPWQGIGITDAGADGSGSSTPLGAGPFWANGDPYLIERDSLFSGVDAQLRVGGRGTELLNTTNDTSSTMWFATNAKHFTTSTVALIDGGVGGTAKVYAPAVPERQAFCFWPSALRSVWGDCSGCDGPDADCPHAPVALDSPA
jgi:hypothetical protein